MKRILLAMSLSICMAATVNAQQEKMSMKSYENEVRKDTIDTLEVKNERHKYLIVGFLQCHLSQVISNNSSILTLYGQPVVRTRTLKGG